MPATYLPLDGTLPVALTGRYVCVAAQGLVQAVDLEAGRAVRYRSRRVTTDSVVTSVISFAGRTLVLGRGALAYELDEQLATISRVDLAGQGRGVGGHPQIDPLTGALHLVSNGDEPSHHVVSPNSQTRITTAVDGAPGPLTDLLLTCERLVLLGNDFVGFADRSGQTTRWVDTELRGAVAAHDFDGAVVVLSTERRLLRWTFGRTGSSCDVLDDTPQRLGTTNPCLTTAPTYVWTVADKGGTEAFGHDLRTGARTCHDFGPGRRPGELTFVPDPARRHREDGGWLLGFVHDDHGDGSELVVLDAAALDRPAIASVPIQRRILGGLHGTWVPATT